MHLIVLENEPSSFRGGQELNLVEICRGLTQRGHKVSLFYVKEGDLLEQYRDFCDHVVKINRYEFNWKKITEILDFLSDIVAGIRKIPVSRNSVVFSNQYKDVFFGYILTVFKSISSVCYLQLPPPSGKFSRQRIIALNGMKQFIAVSKQTKLDWVKRGLQEDKIDVVYNGTNLEKFKPSRKLSTIRKEWNIPENIRVISYIGRLDRSKGLETLIGSVALLRKSVTSTRLLIAGKPVVHFGPDGKVCPEEGERYKQSLKQLSTDLGIEKYVDFLGHITNTTSVYQVSDVTVLPSLWSEPFPRSIIESMACGIPVVASRTGGIPENLTGEFQRGLFEPGNERDLSDTLSQIMNWRATDPQLGERCREHVLSKFTLDKLVDGIEKVLLRVVKQ